VCIREQLAFTSSLYPSIMLRMIAFTLNIDCFFRSFIQGGLLRRRSMPCIMFLLIVVEYKQKKKKKKGEKDCTILSTSRR